MSSAPCGKRLPAVATRLLAAALCAVSINADSSSSGPETVRIAGSAWVGDAPTRVAEARGLFNRDIGKNAPRVEVRHFDSGKQALQALLAGQARFALAATTPTSLALVDKLEGQTASSPSIAVLASIALSNQSHMIVIDSASGIELPHGLAGRRVGVMKNTSSHYGWSHFAGFHDLPEDEAELVDVAISDMADALFEQRIDAAVIWHPWDEPLEEALGDRMVSIPLRALYTLNWLLLVDRDWAGRNPDVVERVLTAYIEAVDFLDAQPERALELQNRNPELDMPELRRMTAPIIWRVGMNWSVLVNLGSQFEWLTQQPGLGEVTIPQPEDYLMGQPLNHIAPARVTLPGYLLMPPAPRSNTP